MSGHKIKKFREWQTRMVMARMCGCNQCALCAEWRAQQMQHGLRMILEMVSNPRRERNEHQQIDR
jgi:hypothetical protein